jgi:hypothetical protein
MPYAHPTPLRALARGLIAGAVGTAAMTAAQTAYLKARDEEPSSTPGEVGRRLVEGVFQRRVPEERMGLLNNAMHWLYGTSWGAIYGLLHASRPVGPLRFTAIVWGASLVHLPAMRLAPPVWEYPPEQLAADVGFHVVYGGGVAIAYAALER